MIDGHNQQLSKEPEWTFVLVVRVVTRRLPEGEHEKSIRSFLSFKLARQAFGQHLWSLHGDWSLLSRHAHEAS